MLIRKSNTEDFGAILAITNEAAPAYQGVYRTIDGMYDTLTVSSSC